MTKGRYHAVVPDTDYYRKMVKCQSACPVQTDARAYVTAVARGELEKGYQIAHDPNPLSTICGRICGAPCEIACRRGSVGPEFESVAIRSLKRVLTERYGPETAGHLPGVSGIESSEVLPEPVRAATPYAEAKGEMTLPGSGASADYSAAAWSRENLKALAAESGHQGGKVAIIGAGPSGLTVAHDLALLGHQVVIYEGGPKTGGMMRYGVPIYRIDQQVMDAEIQGILDLGVTIHFDMRVGRDISLADLRREYDAVFLGMGLMSGRHLNIEGASLDGVITAIDLLLNYNLGYKVTLGKRVIVVGGGDVAMDAARTALRLGQATAEQKTALRETEQRSDEESDAVHEALDVARTALRLAVANVKMISLESWEELPASKFEIEEALEEGITLHPRLGPNRILGQNGKVTGLEVIEVESVFDENRRFNPKFKPKTEYIMECDTVILAIGQSADLNALGGAKDIRVSPRGLVEINPETGQTSAPDVFAGGDVAYGPRLIIHAVRDGHLAALGIDEKIQGRSLQRSVTTQWTDLPTHAMPTGWTKLEREKIPGLPVERRTGLSIVEQGYSLEQASGQGLRCLECSVNTVFDSSKCVLCNGCVDVCPWNCLKIVSIDSVTGDETVTQVLEAARANGAIAAMLKDDTACTRCALCAERCPTDAITMEAFRFKETLTYSGK
ncbi:MAG TPA: FAD-dependent oxidoreductase [Anaerolineales bacterium]|nr:FAD-dependent oxidoreductase [Anaerolineales bacterium]